MSTDLTPSGLMAKASRACVSARLLLDAGDVDHTQACGQGPSYEQA